MLGGGILATMGTGFKNSKHLFGKIATKVIDAPPKQLKPYVQKMRLPYLLVAVSAIGSLVAEYNLVYKAAPNPSHTHNDTSNHSNILYWDSHYSM